MPITQRQVIYTINIIGFAVTLFIIQGITAAQRESTITQRLLSDRIHRATADLTEKLSLSEEQASRVREILTDLQLHLVKADENIDRILDDEQQLKYERLKTQLMEGSRASVGRRSGGGE